MHTCEANGEMNAMNTSWYRFILQPVSLLLLATLMLTPLTPAHGKSNSGRFLLITDIHFNPFYDGTLFSALNAQPATNWQKILASSKRHTFSGYGADSNYALLKSALDDARMRLPDPDFIICPGDLLAHHWQRSYDALAKLSRDEDPKAFRAFTSKAIRFIADEFQKRWPRIPIWITPGNNDSYCGDYRLTPQGPFLSDFADIWASLPGFGEIDSSSFHSTFARGGFYATPLPEMPHHQMIAINSVFFSTHYSNACGKPGQNPVEDQFTWLQGALTRAQRDGKKVWLLMHIPAGINSFASAEGAHFTESAPVTFWHPTLMRRFVALLYKYQGIIQTAFAGHIHMDDFRVIRDDKALLLTKIVPAVSAVFCNNPGYQVYRYDRVTGALLDYETYYLTDLDVVSKSTAAVEGVWKMEYDFNSAYALPGLTASSIERLAEKIRTDQIIRNNYIEFYDVGAPRTFDEQTVRAHCCSIMNLTPAQYGGCLAEAVK